MPDSSKIKSEIEAINLCKEKGVNVEYANEDRSNSLRNINRYGCRKWTFGFH